MEAELVALYRAVSIAELQSVRLEGRLLPGTNSMESGKHLWATRAAAEKYRAELRRLKIEPAADHILKVLFARAVVDSMVTLGDNIDGCGRAYFASEDELTLVKAIQEVEE